MIRWSRSMATLCWKLLSPGESRNWVNSPQRERDALRGKRVWGAPTSVVPAPPQPLQQLGQRPDEAPELLALRGRGGGGD